MISLQDLGNLGTQFLDAVVRRQLRFGRPEPHYPVGGVKTLTGKGGLTNRSQLQQIASWESGDGVAKAVTVVVTAPIGSCPTGGGVFAKVRYGDPRGSTFAWLPVPGIMTVVASSVSVQAMTCGTPYTMTVTAGTTEVVPPLMNPSVTAWTVPVTCLIRDATPSDDPAITFLRNNHIAETNTAALNPIVGPVYIDALELNNESGSPIGVIWGESADGNGIPAVQMGSVIVPANASVAIARQLLGAVAAGFVVVPVTSLTAAAGGAPVISPNANQITMTISGFFVPTL